jgi:hypothetical protein
MNLELEDCPKTDKPTKLVTSNWLNGVWKTGENHAVKQSKYVTRLFVESNFYFEFCVIMRCMII